MSGFLGVFGAAAAPEQNANVLPMGSGLGRRGGGPAEIWRDPDGSSALAVERQPWELEPGFSGPDLVAVDAALAVAADASLYYQADLRRALSEDAAPPGSSPSRLILAAYRRWGERCAERLEGDFAFVLWDRDQRTVVCARDFGGKRPLFYAQIGDSLLVASTIAALLAHPRCPRDLDPVAIAAAAAGLFAGAHETAYRGIRSLPAGWTLIWREGRLRLTRHWALPEVRSGKVLPFEAAAEELRELLGRAVAERLAPSGPTTVWLSGGWDSTAVFAAGERVLGDREDGGHLHPVSISYPPGDPGREDELIEAVAGHWGSPVHWLDIGAIPLLDRPAERAAVREEPFGHAFEMGNRALAQGSRAAGSRVALDGVGGDQLFQVSDVYLADLLLTGRWLSLAREWQRKGLSGRGFRAFFRLALLPLLPSGVRRSAAVVRGGRPLRGHLERPVPNWLRADFVGPSLLLERERLATPARTGWGAASYETSWYLNHPYFPRAFASVAGFGLEQGVEVRSPLYDSRIVAFAVTRPRVERAEGRETKRLLRRAMAGLLPAEVLAPRARRTGVTSGYLMGSLQETFAPYVTAVFDGPLRLAEMGIVDDAALRRRWSEYLRRGGEDLAVNLLLTLHTELWLQGRARDSELLESNHFGSTATVEPPYGRVARNTACVKEESCMT
ncbi:MAG: hypothetical protein H0T90_01770 [Gemmatimonadales bacterium]|nr:hypothetical protein [Gemmatimonadales bacterium]